MSKVGLTGYRPPPRRFHFFCLPLVIGHTEIGLLVDVQVTDESRTIYKVYVNELSRTVVGTLHPRNQVQKKKKTSSFDFVSLRFIKRGPVCRSLIIRS